MGVITGKMLYDRIEQLEAENASLKEQLAAAQKDAEAKQAQIDALMLEYCPTEMMQEQLENWATHQQVADAAILAEQVPCDSIEKEKS